MSDKQLDLDKHRGMAEQKATDIRRILADVENNAKDLRDRQGILENQLLSAPAASWPEAAAKARLAPPWSAAWAAPSRAGPSIAEQGSDHHRDARPAGWRTRASPGSAMGRRPARGWLVQRVRHKRSVTVDVGRYHGQQIAHPHPRWRGRLSVWSSGECYPACGQFYGAPQFKYYKIRRFTPARLTWLGANRLEASVQGPWTS